MTFNPNPARRRVLLMGAALLATGLAGCGRKGPLDPPPGAPLPKKKAADQEDPNAPGASEVLPTINSVDPLTGQINRPPPRPPVVPDQDFILDPLL